MYMFCKGFLKAGSASRKRFGSETNKEFLMKFMILIAAVNVANP